MSTALVVLLCVAGAVVAVPTFWLALEVGWPRPGRTRRAGPHSGARPSLAVLVPAYNEAAGIGTTLRTIRRQLQPQDRLLVVADNCTDHTAAIAAANGATVVERVHDTAKGKGHALAFGFAALDAEPRDVLVMVDADCQLTPGALDALAHQAATTGRPAQALYLMGNPTGHAAPVPLRRRFAEFAWRLKNGLRPLGLLDMGLPCPLTGSGMALPWGLARQHNLASGHLAEDMELGIALTMAGAAPLHCPEAVVTSVFPIDEPATQGQRRRWEHGHLSLMRQGLPRLLRSWLRRPRAATLAMALDLAIPPLSLLALANGLLLLTSGVATAATGRPEPLALGVVNTVVFITAAWLAWLRVGRGLLSGRDLLRLPLLAAAKLPLYAGFVLRPQRNWVRTRRASEAAAGRPLLPRLHKRTDFSRDVVAVLGVPFDVVGQAQAEHRLIEAMNEGERLFLSTPNLNFVAMCQRDAAFAATVRVSDLSVADGSGVLLVARLLGTPLPERVAGSTLFDNLVRHVPRTLKTFLFGGAPGIAERAAQRLNERTGQHAAVGWLSPGFGESATLVDTADLARMQQARPNFLLVALGAKKGQQWIVNHLDQLPACVVSHLGATINFLAGTVVRAPERVQRLGLEWAWRIKEEPRLWLRYAGDALVVARAVAARALHRGLLEPLLLPRGDSPATLAVEQHDGHAVLHLGGTWQRGQAHRLGLTLAALTREPQDVTVHCEADARLDAFIVGKLLLLHGHQAGTQRALHLACERAALRRTLRQQGLQDLAATNAAIAAAEEAPAHVNREPVWAVDAPPRRQASASTA